MTTYIVRRLLLMIPTLIGITFLVFMLIALSPGGIGAGLRVQGGGQMEATSVAIQQAYLNDRYGLDDPPVVQYVRWLGRVSPVKFGERDQVNLAGELVRAPKEPGEPLLWRWFAEELSPDRSLPEFSFPEGATAEERASIYQRLANTYARSRGRVIAGEARLKQALGVYAGEVGLEGAMTSRGEPRTEVFAGHEPLTTARSWPAVREAGEALVADYHAAVRDRAALLAAFRAKPFREAGVAVVPGVVSLSKPDLGVSFSRTRPVWDLIMEALPVTLMLNLIAFAIIYAVAVPTGILAAVRRGSFLDVGLGALYVALWSFPIPLAGILAIGYLANDQYLGWFPESGISASGAERMAFLPSMGGGGFERGWLLDRAWHICLPVFCLVYGGFAVLSKQTRAAMLDNFNQDYVRTAKAKGVAPKDVTFRHVFRNSLLPVITMFVSVFPAMLSGSVVIESIFTVNGMGRLALEAINLRDRELILATTLMIATVNIVALLLADVLYALADPRISYE